MCIYGLFLILDICLYLVKCLLKVNLYNCSGFCFGCLIKVFIFSKLFECKYECLYLVCEFK